MQKHNKHLTQLLLFLPIHLLIATICLVVSFFSDMTALSLLMLFIAAQAVFFFLSKNLSKKFITKMERNLSAQRQLLETSYAEKLTALNTQFQKNKAAYRILQKKYKELKVSTASPSASDAAAPPASAYILPYSKADSADLKLYTVIQAVIQELTPFSQAHQIRIQLVAAQEDIFFHCHIGHLRILFRNIIDNSIKYMKRPGNLVITLSLIGDDIFIIFKDDGAGLPSAELKHIFKLNYQGSNRTSGNGLGLAQAKAIVDFYHGTIFAKSHPGNGMAIYIQFPLSTQNQK